MAKRTGLGKGLDALIPAGQSAPSSEGGVTQISVDLIQRNPRQPREKFDIEELENLAASIREHGIIQPLIVSPPVGNMYTLIAGERRWRATTTRSTPRTWFTEPGSPNPAPGEGKADAGSRFLELSSRNHWPKSR